MSFDGDKRLDYLIDQLRCSAGWAPGGIRGQSHPRRLGMRPGTQCCCAVQVGFSV